MKSLGINRLSIGIQSFDDSLLKSVNRNHTVDDAYEAVRNALKTGFGDINLDLIYALPGSSRQTLQSDLNKITELSPEHISIYSYTVENKTVFENWLKKGKIELITEDEEADQYQMIIDHFKKEGYQQYEISNFAKERHYSKHNSSYWNLTPYLGIGPSAHSLHNNKRWSNTSNNSQYMQAIESGSFPSQIEILSNETLSSEYIFTSIRTIWGCDLNKLVNDFGVDLLDKNRIEIDKLIQSEHIIIEGDQLSLTERGKLLADEIASRLYILEDNIE